MRFTVLIIHFIIYHLKSSLLQALYLLHNKFLIHQYLLHNKFLIHQYLDWKNIAELKQELLFI